MLQDSQCPLLRMPCCFALPDLMSSRDLEGELCLRFPAALSFRGTEKEDGGLSVANVGLLHAEQSQTP